MRKLIILAAFFFLGGCLEQEVNLEDSVAVINVGDKIGTSVAISDYYLLSAYHIIEQFSEDTPITIKFKEWEEPKEVFIDKIYPDIDLVILTSDIPLKRSFYPKLICNNVTKGTDTTIIGHLLGIEYSHFYGKTVSDIIDNRIYLVDSVGGFGLSGGPTFNKDNNLIGVFSGFIVTPNLFIDIQLSTLSTVVPVSLICDHFK